MLNAHFSVVCFMGAVYTDTIANQSNGLNGVAQTFISWFHNGRQVQQDVGVLNSEQHML